MNATVKYNDDCQVEWFTVSGDTPKFRFDMEGSTAVLTNVMAGDYDGEVYGREISKAMWYAEKLPFVQATMIEHSGERQ